MNIYKLTFSLVIVSAILLQACGIGNSSDETTDLKILKFEEASDSLNLSANFKNISCIQLEMTENSTLNKIKTILDVDGNIVVLTKDYEICVFNKENGKFIRQIGSVGEGPEEFITAKEICYDFNNKTILVFDALKVEFISYKLTGEYVGRFKTKEVMPAVNSIVRASDGTMLTCNNLLSDIPDQSAYTVINPDLTINEIDPFAPLVQPKKGNSSFSNVWAQKPMSVCGDELKFVKVLTDTLCVIKEGKVTPLYKLDFGKEILTKEKIMEIGSWEGECLEYCMTNKLFPSVKNMFETSRFVVIFPNIEYEVGSYWIDKQSQNGFHISSTYDYDMEVKKVILGKTIIQIKGSNENNLISCFEGATAFDAFKDAIKANRDKIVLPDNVVDAIGSFDPEGNPFLIIYSN